MSQQIDRVFLDANIFFSAGYGPSRLDQLWKLQRIEKCVLLASEHVIEEAKRNLTDERKLQRLDSYLSDIVIVPEMDSSIECHIDLPQGDEEVPMAAVSANADFLLTGDIKHFGKYFGQKVMGVKILMPRDYLATL